MAIIRNTAGQGLYVYAHDTAADEPETGDAANITATISLDGGADVATTDVNPDETGGGVYWFDLTQGETNAGAFVVIPVSATADVQLDPVMVLTQEIALTGLPAAIWNVLTATLTTAGSIGKFIVDYLTAIAAKTTLIGTGNAVATVPITAAGDVTVIRGDSYLDADGRRLEWEGTTWAIAVASTLAVIVQDVENFTATRISATEVGLELTSAQTTALPVILGVPYSLQEIKATGERITLAQGSWTTATRPIPLV